MVSSSSRKARKMESILVSVIDLGRQEILASEAHPLHPKSSGRLRSSRGDGSNEPGTMDEKEKHHVTTGKIHGINPPK